MSADLSEVNGRLWASAELRCASPSEGSEPRPPGGQSLWASAELRCASPGAGSEPRPPGGQSLCVQKDGLCALEGLETLACTEHHRLARPIRDVDRDLG